MGLDMFAFKIRKVTAEELASINSYEDVRNGLNAISVADFNDNPEMFNDLGPYVTKKALSTSYINYDKIREDFGIPEKAHCVGERYSAEGWSFSYRWEDGEEKQNKKVSISAESKDEYLITKDTDFFLFHCTDVGYWRKDYELQDEIYDGFHFAGTEVENCGYYKVNDDVFELIRDDLSEEGVDAYLSEDADTGLFYHEWY